MKTVNFTIDDRNPKLDRKDLCVIRTLIPCWFRGDDMKLAQTAVKLATRVNKILATNDRRFALTFESKRDEDGQEYGLKISYSADDGTHCLAFGYADSTIGEEIMPTDGLIAQINDIARIDFRAVLAPVLGTSYEKIHREVTEMLLTMMGHCSVTSALVSEESLEFTLQVKNHHGRAFWFRLNPH